MRAKARESERLSYAQNPAAGTMLAAPAGGQAEAEFDFYNDSPDVASFYLEVDGLGPNWASGIGTAYESYAPSAGGGQLRLTLTPPIMSAVGEYDFRVRLMSGGTPVNDGTALILRVDPPLDQPVEDFAPSSVEPVSVEPVEAVAPPLPVVAEPKADPVVETPIAPTAEEAAVQKTRTPRTRTTVKPASLEPIIPEPITAVAETVKPESIAPVFVAPVSVAPVEAPPSCRARQAEATRRRGDPPPVPVADLAPPSTPAPPTSKPTPPQPSWQQAQPVQPVPVPQELPVQSVPTPQPTPRRPVPQPVSPPVSGAPQPTPPRPTPAPVTPSRSAPPSEEPVLVDYNPRATSTASQTAVEDEEDTSVTEPFLLDPKDGVLVLLRPGETMLLRFPFVNEAPRERTYNS